jgi:hypothetical protein
MYGEVNNMCIELLKVYRDSDEVGHNHKYGDKFFKELNKYFETEQILIQDVTSLISCLDNLDETRNIFHYEIKKIIFYCIEKKEDFNKLISLLNYNNEKYDQTEIYFNFFKDMSVSIISNKMSIDDAIIQLQEIK